MKYFNIKESYFYSLLIICSLLLIFALPITYLIHFSVDDSYFYIQTAKNFADGYGSTFDKVNYTNGYHPCWFLILALYFYLINIVGNFTPDYLFRFVFLLVVIINLISVKILSNLIENKWKLNKLTKSTIYLFLFPLSLLNIVGLESQLLFMLIIFYYSVRSNAFNVSNGIREILKVFLMSCIILTRLEFLLIFYVPITGYELIKGQFRYCKKLNKLTLVALPAIVFALYLGFNYYYFNHLITISSYIKLDYSTFHLMENLPQPILDPINFLFAGFYFFSMIPLIIVKYLLQKKTKLPETEILFGYAGSFVFLLVHFSFNKGGVREWYYIIPNAFAVLVLTVWSSQYKIIRRLLFSLSLIVCIIYFFYFRLFYYNSDDAYEYAGRISDLVHEHETIYQVDYSGMISFFSNRKIINGDGLINSFEYYDHIKNKKLDNYFKKHPFNYYSTFMYGEVDTIKNFTDTMFKPGGYEFRFPMDKLRLKSYKRYGGVFRHKKGYFLLFENTGI
ncbi:MAG: hypothetical protein AB9882_00315 [Ignavibacteriaceae bacterium]